MVVITVLAALLVTGSVGDVREYVNVRDWVRPHPGARDQNRNRTAGNRTLRRSADTGGASRELRNT
jgi:hypothetical protein